MVEQWWQRGAIYQIYPRSFSDSDGDGIGDLPGITSRLDYLKSLGVEAIWLSPFYRSPMADFGYDVADYRDVDPVFGTMGDFERLLEEAHARGIRVVIDFVPNHSSDQHEWFRAARGDRENPKRDWYVWRDGRDGGPPNNWGSSFKAAGPAWTFDERTGQWYLHSFLPEQPDLNWDNPAVEAAMHDVMRFCLDRGVDGFRIDVVHKLAKDPELGDIVPGRPPPHEDWEPTIRERMRGLRAVVDEYEDRMLVGEVYLLDLRRLLSYVNSGDELHMAHNFVFVNLPWDADTFRSTIDQFEALSTHAAWPAWFLANHDHSRVASRFGPGPARAVLLMLYALRGTPFIYQGEELGLPDAHVPPDRIVDVDGRDPERAPIPWTSRPPGYGFTTGEPWLPFVARGAELSVEAQERDPASALNLTRRLARLRTEHSALRSGEQRSVHGGDDLLAWLRVDQDEQLLSIVNFAPEPRRWTCPPDLPARGALLLSTGRRAGGRVDLGKLTLAPDEALSIQLDE